MVTYQKQVISYQFIFAQTEGVPHNTITPIARLQAELKALEDAILNGTDIAYDEALSKHGPW